MKTCQSSHACRLLGWVVPFALAVALVIAAMVDYCLSPRDRFGWHVGLAAVVFGVLFLLPATRRLRPWLRRLALAMPAAFLAVVIHANVCAVWASRGRMFSEVDAVPATKVALVFGTSDRVNGRENRYFRYRIDAAEQLWKSGRIGTLIVSGDNRSTYYNEPERMRQALMRRGIPDARIVRDYAGLRTLDSVVRAKEVFGTTSLLFISQRFQNERAIYLAKANGIDAFAFNARDVDTHEGIKTKLREVGARVKMWLDVHFLKTRPRYLGGKEPLPE